MRIVLNLFRVLGILSLIAFLTMLMFRDKNFPALKYPLSTIWTVGYISLGLLLTVVVLHIFLHITKRPH